MEGASPTGHDHVEAREVSARTTSISVAHGPEITCSAEIEQACVANTCSLPWRVMASGNALASPLSEVTFVVVDLETTGALADADAITEIGALKLRGGELLGRFETLVNPGVPIPPMITVLTGITEAMVLPAPRDRRSAADVPRVPRRRGDRRPQHPLRLQLPRRRARRARLPAAAEPARRHDRDRPPPRPRRGPESAPAHARAPLPDRRSNRCTARTPTRPRPPRCCTRCSSTRRRSACSASTTCSRCRRSAPTRRRPSSRSRRGCRGVPGVYLFRDRGGARALRRQGDEPARARPLLLLDRGPPQGPAAAARDGAHRAPRVRGPVRGRGPRAAPDPTPRPASTARRSRGAATRT